MGKASQPKGRFSSGLLNMKFMQKDVLNNTPTLSDFSKKSSQSAVENKASIDDNKSEGFKLEKTDPGQWGTKPILKTNKKNLEIGFSDIFEPVNARMTFGNTAKRSAPEPDKPKKKPGKTHERNGKKKSRESKMRE